MIKSVKNQQIPYDYLSRFSLLLLLAVFITNAHAQFFQYDDNERRPNQLFFSRIPSYTPPFCKRLRATSIADIFNDRIERFSGNEGIVTPDYFKKCVGTQPIHSHKKLPVFERLNGKSTLPVNESRERDGQAERLNLNLPEVMQNEREQTFGKQLIRKNRRKPFLFPPHLLPPEATETVDAEKLSQPAPIESTISESTLPVLPPPRPQVQEATSTPKSIDYPSLPILIPPKPEAADTSTDRQTTQSIGMQKPSQQSATSRLPQKALFKEEQRFFHRGLEAFKYRNYIQARKTFSELVRLNPDSAQAQFGHGICLFYAGEYENALQTIGNSYRLAKHNGMPEPTVWDLRIDPGDFRYHHRKLARYVNANPQNKTTGTLLFLLTHAGVMPKPVSN